MPSLRFASPLALVACTSLLGIDGDYSLGGPDSGAAAGGEPFHPQAGGRSGLPEASPAGGEAGSSGGWVTDAASFGGAPLDASNGDGWRDATPPREAAPPRHECDVDIECGDHMKCCLNLCIEEQPLVGCARSGCEPCPAPPLNGIATCDQGQCAMQCIPGHVMVRNECKVAPPEEPDASAGMEDGGGSGGAMGAGGQSGAGGTPPGTGGAVQECRLEECSPLSCPLIPSLPCCRNDGECGCTPLLPGPGCF